MIQLTNEEVNMIAQKIESGEIVSRELHDDLLDHFCCAVEALRNKGIPFSEAYSAAYQQICPDGIGEIQNELVTSKSIRLMKNSTIVLGIVAISTACIGAWFKMCHWPMANIFLLIALLSLVAGFLPMFFMYNYQQDKLRHTAAKSKNIAGYISLSFIAIGATGKVFHFPGTMLFFLIGFLLLNIVFVPYVFLKRFKKI